MIAQPPYDMTIERFAQIVAGADDAHAPHPSVLEAAGLDGDTWKHLERDWMVRLAGADDPDLALRFATGYSRARNSPSSATPVASPASSSKRTEDREDCLCVPHDVDQTLPSGTAPPDVVNDTLPDPVHAAASGTSPLPPTAPAELNGPVCEADATRHARRSARSAAVDVTVEGTPEAPVGDVLPFAVPVGPVPAVEKHAPPGKRWHYFDTQSGKPLAVPVLTDVPKATRISGERCW
jgi:hypothetical protein